MGTIEAINSSFTYLPRNSKLFVSLSESRFFRGTHMIKGNLMNFDKDKEICVCNSVTLGEIVEFVKANNIQSLTSLIEQGDMPIGDKCEACHEDGYENDGYSLAMILSMVQQGRM